jgi:O-antigen/teichoic acid export membrane protein
MSVAVAQIPVPIPRQSSDVGRRYVRAALQTGVGGVVSRVLQGFTPMILARYLGPKDFGVYALVLSLVGIMAAFSPLGQDTALEKFLPEYALKDPRRGGAILANTLILFSAVLAAVCIGFYFLSGWIASALYHESSLAPVFRFSAVLILVLSLFNLGTSAVAGLQDFKTYSLAMIVRGAMFLGLGWLGVCLLGFYGALLGQLLAGLAGLSLLAAATFKGSRRRFAGWVRPHFSRRLMREIFGLACPVLLTGLLVTPAYWWANTLLARRSGFAVVGLFSVAFSLMQLILLVPTNLSIPAVSFLSETHSRGQGFGSLVGANFRLMWAITLPIAAAFALLSGPVIRLTFGPQYERAAPLVVAMSFAALMMVLNSVVVNACWGRGYVWQAFFFHLGWLGVFLAIGYRLIPAWGAMGLACAFVFSYAPLALCAALYAARVLGARFTKTPALLALSAIAFAASLALQRVALGPRLVAMGGAVLLVPVIAEWIWVFDPAERAEARCRCWALLRAWTTRRGTPWRAPTRAETGARLELDGGPRDASGVPTEFETLNL